ncbi:MAG TPA: hypothetical protein VFC90_02875 [Planctomycetota bacterium]|nr:hypothetical protein [Planctomycetota bacterium]
MKLTIAALAVALAASLPGAAQETEKKEKKSHPGLERLKKLVGTWQADTKQMGKVNVTYRVVSGGSTVMETIMPGQPHEMVTMYHLDGDDLVLTHYCAIGNQPRMKAQKDSKEGTLDFRCVGGSNMKCDTDAHMHSAFFTFKDDDNFTAEWGLMKDGKPDHAMKFEYVRQKK